MKSMKFARMMILALGLVALATASSFASVQFSAASAPLVMNTDAQAGLIGSVKLTPVAPGTISAGEVITYALPSNVPISYLNDICITMVGSLGTGQRFTKYFGTTEAQFIDSSTTVTAASGNINFSSYGVPIVTTTAAGTSGGNNPGVVVTVGTASPLNMSIITLSFYTNVSFGASDYITFNGVRVDPVQVASGSGSMLNVILSSTNSILGTPDATFANNTLFVASFFNGSNAMSALYTGADNSIGQPLQFRVDGIPVTNNSGQVLNKLTVTLKEVFPNAWETRPNSASLSIYNGATSTYKYYVNDAPTRIKFAFDFGNTNLVVTDVRMSTTDPGLSVGNGQTTGGTTGSGGIPPVTQLGFNTNPLLIAINAQDKTAFETIQLYFVFNVKPGLVLPTAPSPINVKISLYPPAPTLTGGGVDYPLNKASGANTFAGTYYTPYQLKYRENPNTLQVTIPVSLRVLDSNLLATYGTVYRTSTSGDPVYNTGIAISNLSGSNPTGSYPLATPGTIDVSLYPMDLAQVGKSWSFNTSVLPAGAKSGLNDKGELPSMGTWTVLLTQLLKPAGLPEFGDFHGFMRFHCNFPEAAGFALFSDGGFANYAAGVPMIADMPAPITNPMTPNAQVEIPGF